MVGGKVNRQAVWQTLRMYDVESKVINVVTNMYVNSLACVIVNRIYRGVEKYMWGF